MTKPKPIKPFRSLDEEAKFWDTHDLSGVIKDSRIPISELLLIESEAKKEAVLTLRLQKKVKERINLLAKKKGINPATLSRMWLVEKLIEEEKSKKHLVT